MKATNKITCKPTIRNEWYETPQFHMIEISSAHVNSDRTPNPGLFQTDLCCPENNKKKKVLH
jgi:hypothetical protein